MSDALHSIKNFRQATATRVTPCRMKVATCARQG